jgi:hypothetical protein
MMMMTKRMRMRMMCVVVMMGQVHGRVPGEDAEGGLHTGLQVDRWKHERGMETQGEEGRLSEGASYTSVIVSIML